MQPEGGAIIQMKWSDLDLDLGKSNHPLQASERIISELVKTPDYEWLGILVEEYLDKKYCLDCRFQTIGDVAKCVNQQGVKPFPYCFEKSDPATTTIPTPAKHEYVQLFNPAHKLWVKVDKTIGGVVASRKTKFPHIPVAPAVTTQEDK